MALFTDVNLDKLVFSSDGKSIDIYLIDMYEGASIGTLRCSSVFLCNYQNSFVDDDCLACYVGEVEYTKLDNSSENEFLKKLGYGFYNKDGGLYRPESNELFHIHIEGSEVMLDIICGSFDVLSCAKTNPVLSCPPVRD